MKTHVDFAMEAFDNFLIERKIDAQGLNVLDVGCRDKVCKPGLEKHSMNWTGVDPFPASEDLMRGFMEYMPFIADDSFDVVFACHSFEHCEHPVDALRELRRILKPGGYLFVATPYPCKHHILEADPDHIFVLMPMQMARLLHYTAYEELSCSVWPGDIEQNRTIVSVGRKAL